METMTGQCKFCGQINAFKWVGESIPVDEDLIAEATRVCSCEAARESRDIEYRINAACECLDRILPGAEEEPTKILLKNAIPYVAKNQLHKVSINIGNGTKVSVERTGEKIKVNRNDSSSRLETV